MSALVDPTTGEVVADCTPDEARQLTERIRSTADALWQLLASRRHGAARSPRRRRAGGRPVDHRSACPAVAS